MSHNKDTDYLTISARVHAMERRLLTRERMERMIEAKDHAEAAKVLSECGYGELAEVSGTALEKMLASAQAEVFQDLRSAVPDPNLIDVFRIKYDYHNAKVLIKAAARGVEPGPLLLGGGRYDPEALLDAYRRDDLRDVSEPFRQAMARAQETLASTGDPQLCDLILDRACYEELTLAAQASGSEFIQGYVKLLIDAVNLRSAVRCARLGKEADFLSRALLPGGNVETGALAAARGEELGELFRSGLLAEAAQAGAAVSAPGSGPLTEFEKLCDDAVTAYLAAARRIPFGEQTVVGYLYAREAELTAIRTILNGRLAGLDGSVIRQRLREPYA